MNLKNNDPRIYNLINNDLKRQKENLILIPSENFTSKAVREAEGSVVMHKYSEGQIEKRYYEGNEIIDQIESVCKKRALKTFNLDSRWHVNVQPYSGSIANLSVYNALIKPGDKIMGMYLFDGGHLSHGWKYKDKPISFSSKVYEVAYYHVNSDTGIFDYNEVEKIAFHEKPQILISGGTAYPREIDHQRLSKIAEKINAYYVADIAHEAGLVAAGVNQSPFPFADVVTMTTHKTLRGPKGALIFCKKEFADVIDRSVFPGIQGGPINNTIAAIAVCLKEAQFRSFKTYAKQVIFNAKALAQELGKYQFKLVSGGTDKHLILIDLQNKKISGRYAARALSLAGITTNKNTIPNEKGSPANPSGIRIGTPAVTTRGMKEKEMGIIASIINEVINEAKLYTDLDFEKFEKKAASLKRIQDIKKKVKSLCLKFPLPE